MDIGANIMKKYVKNNDEALKLLTYMTKPASKIQVLNAIIDITNSGGTYGYIISQSADCMDEEFNLTLVEEEIQLLCNDVVIYLNNYDINDSYFKIMDHMLKNLKNIVLYFDHPETGCRIYYIYEEKISKSIMQVVVVDYKNKRFALSKENLLFFKQIVENSINTIIACENRLDRKLYDNEILSSKYHYYGAEFTYYPFAVNGEGGEKKLYEVLINECENLKMYKDGFIEITIDNTSFPIFIHKDLGYVSIPKEMDNNEIFHPLVNAFNKYLS